MIGERFRQVLRVIAVVLTALLLFVTVSVVFLRLTNPRLHKAKQWMRAAAMPSARGEVAGALVGQEFVVAGGLHGVGRTSDAVDVYDIQRNEWTRARSLPAPRHHAAAASGGRYVYLTGGAPRATDWTPTDTLWRSLPGLPWKRLARMPEGRQGHAMVAIGKRLYVVGGVGRTDRTLIYDIDRDRWTAGAPLPVGRDHLRAVAYGGEVWAIGGRVGTPVRNVDIYDPKTDAWRPGPRLPSPMSAMAVGVLEDNIHVVGGEDPRFVRGRVIDEHVFIGAGDRTWRTAPGAALPVHGAASCVYVNLLIVTGGATREGLLSTISWTPVTQMYRSDPYLKRIVR